MPTCEKCGDGLAPNQDGTKCIPCIDPNTEVVNGQCQCNADGFALKTVPRVTTLTGATVSEDNKYVCTKCADTSANQDQSSFWRGPRTIPTDKCRPCSDPNKTY